MRKLVYSARFKQVNCNVLVKRSHVSEATNEKTSYEFTSAAQVDMGWQGVYKRSHAAPWNQFWSGCRPVRTSSEVPVSEMAGGSGAGMDVWSQPGGGLTAPHHWPDLGFLHVGYAPATCWAGLFGRLRPGGKLRPLEINPLMEPTTVGSLWLENDLHENELQFESHMGRSKKFVRIISDEIHGNPRDLKICIAPAAPPLCHGAVNPCTQSEWEEIPWN